MKIYRNIPVSAPLKSMNFFEHALNCLQTVQIYETYFFFNKHNINVKIIYISNVNVYNFT